jgi:lipopolysaccharide export system protein LptA
VINFLDEKTGQKVHATGQKAVYDYRVVNAVTNEVLELTGNPAVESAGKGRSGWMTADTITVDRAQGRIWGTGNHHSVLKKNPGEPASLDTEIFSDRFDFAMSTGLSVYEGSVRAYDPAMNLTSKTLTLKLANAATSQTNSLERAEATGDVVIDLIQKPFVTADVTNLAALATRLKQPAKDDTAAKYVASKLSPVTSELLIIHTPETDSQLKQALVLELNRLAESGSLYESGQFTNVFLSLDTTALLRQQPLGTDLVQLNRLLLLDAFRGQLARGRTGEKILATGDRAIYSNTIANNTTNLVLELIGHPKLKKPNEVITADDTIIYNRTTGDTHFVGRPHFHATVDGLAKMPVAGGKAPK